MSKLDIVFDIGGTRFRSGLIDEAGRISSRVSFDSPSRPDEVVEHIQRIVQSFSVTTTDPVVGIAIGGMVEKNGMVTAGSMNMVDFPLAERLGLSLPVTVLNDAKAAALAESLHNPRLGCRNSFCLIAISSGIGGGIVINGELYEGHRGTAGEVGHLIIDHHQNFYCRLGHRGCLDALASGRALKNRMKKLWREGHWTNLEKGVDLDDLTGLLVAGDGMAQRLIRETGAWIGYAIMQIIRVFDPCEIVFKGALITELWPFLEPHINAVLSSYDRHIPMSLSSLGDNVGLVGAGIAAQRMRATLAKV